MSYADVTRLGGDLPLESLQSLRKTNRASKTETARPGVAEKSTAKDSADLQRAASPDVETYQRIRSPELAAGLTQDLSQQIVENPAELLLAQANLGAQLLFHLQE